MTDILLLVIIAMLGWMIHTVKKDRTPKSEQCEALPRQALPELQGKTCEVKVKDSMAAIDVMFSVRGTLLDHDEAWILLEVPEKKKTTRKLLRIDNIQDIEEIQ